MPLLYYVQTSLTGLAIILLIFFRLGTSDPYMGASQKVFKALIFSNMALLLLEMLLNIFTGVSSAAARAILPPVVCFFFIMNPVPEALWVLYLDATIRRGEKRLRRRFLAVLLLPVAANAVLAFASLSNGYVFAIDAQNVYHRGPFFWLMPLICYSYVIYYIFLMVVKRKYILKHEFSSLLIAVAPTLAAGLLQSFFYGISVLWLSLSFSLLIVYLNLQSSKVNTDHLTGLANRRWFDVRLRSLSRRQKRIGGIMIDIDSFKEINDEYGHVVGDSVLESVGALLKRSLRKGDFVARVGGDEFAVLLDVQDMEELANAVSRLRESVAHFNTERRFPFPLHLSVGYDVWDTNTEETQEQFYHRIDTRMYEAKRGAAMLPEIPM